MGGEVFVHAPLYLQHACLRATRCGRSCSWVRLRHGDGACTCMHPCCGTQCHSESTIIACSSMVHGSHRGWMVVRHGLECGVRSARFTRLDSCNCCRILISTGTLPAVCASLLACSLTVAHPGVRAHMPHPLSVPDPEGSSSLAVGNLVRIWFTIAGCSPSALCGP